MAGGSRKGGQISNVLICGIKVLVERHSISGKMDILQFDLGDLNDIDNSMIVISGPLLLA